jgi:hypothetical protein
MSALTAEVSYAFPSLHVRVICFIKFVMNVERLA